MMSPEQSAKELQKSLKASAGALSVWPWHGDDGVRLIVRIALWLPISQLDIPERFHGYKVDVERRQTPKAGLG